MPTALMSNPPGLRRNPLMALVANPPSKDRTMAKAKKSKKRSAAKARRTAPKKAAPVAVARPAPVRRKKRTARKAAPVRSLAVVKGPAGGLRTIKLNPKRRKFTRGGGRGVLCNPITGASGLFADLKALPGELSSLATPAGMIWAGAGVGTSAVFGAVIAPHIANMIPVSSPMAARIANGATYALAGTVPALFIKDPSKRRKFMLGVIGMAASEFMFPGWSADVARKVPVVGKWIPTPAMPKALNDDLLESLPTTTNLGGWTKRPVGGFFAKTTGAKPVTAVRKAPGTLRDLVQLSADLRIPSMDPLKDRSGALAGIDPMKDRSGALAGLALGAI